MVLRLHVALAFPLLALAAPLAAAEGDDASIQKQFEAMQERLESVEADRERMRQQIDELRAATDDGWVTEKRAEEIRSIVADVMADADTRSSTLQNGLMAGWSDHFFLASPDGRFKLEIDGQMQFRYVLNYREEQQDNYRAGFENTRSKLTLRGHVFRPELTYLFRMDATRNEPGLVEGLFFVRDMWMQYQFTNTTSLRFGQFKLPYNREELVSSAYQLTVERSEINENMNVGRSQGIMLTYADETNRFDFAYSDGGVDSIGGFGNVVGTNPVNTPWSDRDTEWAFTTRYEKLIAGNWQQFQDLTSPPGDEFGMLVGIAGHFQDGEFDGDFSPRRNETFWANATIDISVEYGGANLFGAFMYSHADNGSFGDINVYGAVLQGGIYLNPKTEFFARWQYGWWDFDNLQSSALNLLTVGWNYYFDGHDFKWTTDLGWSFDRIDQTWDSDIAGSRAQTDGNLQVIFRTQLQLLF